MTTVVTPAAANKSRWGYHPCSFQTFTQLKALNKRRFAALRRWAACKRWARKAPHNRHGSEPVMDTMFCRQVEKVTNWAGAKYVREGIKYLVWEFDDLGIEYAYRTARFPAANPEEVVDMGITAERVAELAATS